MKIAVYCGSGSGNDKAFVQAAQDLGRWIGERGHTLVYGGGDSGLMGETASEAKKAGAHVIGVVPGNVEFIASRPQPYCDEVIRTAGMSERKQEMLEKSDAFIALPGGIGTLDEMSEAITLTKIGVFNKKCVLFNKNGFYNLLKDFFDNMEKCGFLTAAEMKHVCFAGSVEEIEKFLG